MCDMEAGPKDHKICRGCLSSGRQLSPVAAGHFYYSLLTEEQKIHALTQPCVALCWECKARLRRSQKFQAQVRAAHTILENCVGYSPATPSLSSLGTHHKLLYDAVFEENIRNDDLLFFSVHDKIVIPTKYKTKAIKEENSKKVEDGNVVEITTDVRYDSRDDSDNSDYYDDDDDNIPNSPEITKSPRKCLQKVEIVERNVKQSKKHIKNSIVKTPELLKLEQELQKFMQNRKKEASKHLATPSLKKCDSTKENDDKDDDVGNTDKNKRKRKLKENKPESDSDFSLGEESESNSEPEHDSSDKLDNCNKKRRIKIIKYQKKIMLSKNIADAMSCFTEVEMSVSDLKITLEKEDAIVNDKRPRRCNVCGLSFQLFKTLNDHAHRYHKATHRAHFRKGSFQNPPPTMPEKPCLLRCNICGRMFRREHAVAHVNECHRVQYFCQGPGCEWLERGLWSKEDHAQHWETVHRRSTCDICGVTKKRKSTLELHMQEVHLKILSLQCPQCESTYDKLKSLKQHLKQKHTEPEPAERRYCVECDVTYPTSQRLNQHFHSAHSKRKYPCGQCGRVMASKTNYQKHYQLYHVGKTKYCCHICGKYFAYTHGLAAHLNAHNNVKMPKTKPCTVCGRMFQTNRNLRHHMSTHTGDRPYKCEHCDAAYTQPYCLQVHLKKQHDIDQKVPTAKSNFWNT